MFVSDEICRIDLLDELIFNFYNLRRNVYKKCLFLSENILTQSEYYMHVSTIVERVEVIITISLCLTELLIVSIH